MLQRDVDVDVLAEFLIRERQQGIEVLKRQLVLAHLAVDVREGEVDFLVVGLKRQQVFQSRDGLNVLSIAGQDLGFTQLQAQTLGVQATCKVVDLLRFPHRPAVEVMLDKEFEIVVVEELGFARVDHGFKRLGQGLNLFFSLMWTSFVVHSFPKYTAKVGRSSG